MLELHRFRHRGHTDLELEFLDEVLDRLELRRRFEFERRLGFRWDELRIEFGRLRGATPF